jgi:phosphoribosylaminoimidazole-succinocarboxamide synthase
MDSYNKCIDNGVPPKQLSKEFFRQWLIKNSFQGKENQNLPKITDEIINDVSNRYIELYNQILGIKFDKSNSTNSISQIEKNIIKELEIL